MNEQRPNIVAIDDLQENLDMFEAILNQYLPDCSFHSATDAESGLATIRSIQPDVILIDAKLPDVDGFELCHVVKNDPDLRPIPVLMVSGVLTKAEHRVLGLESGADGYLCKPFQAAELVSEIKAMLRIREYERALVEQEQRRRIEEALRQIAAGVSSSTGFAFFFSLVQSLAETLHVDHAFIGECDESEPDIVRTIAFLSHGKNVEPFDYSSASAPCTTVIGKSLRYYPERAYERFPGHPLFRGEAIEAYMGIPLFSSDGKSLGLVAVMHAKPLDDSELGASMLRIFAARAAAELERMRATEELWQSEARYRSLTDDVLDSSDVGIFIYNASYRLVWANEIVETYFGVRRSECIGMTATDLVHGKLKTIVDRPEEWSRRLTESYDPNRPMLRFQFRIRAGPGRDERWLEHISQPIRSGLYAGGRIEHYSDITPLRRLHDQLTQSQKMEGIGRLAGGVAHDFNNLLTSIMGCAHLIAEELPEGHPMRANADEILMAAKRAERLTRQLLVFSRKQISQEKLLAGHEVVRNMEPLLSRTLGEDIHIHFELEAEASLIRVDEAQLEQIVMNLVINAREAMPKGGSLSIATETCRISERDVPDLINGRPGRYWKLTFRDTGHGMSRETQERAFDPFFTTKEPGHGTGLGLSIVYSITEQMGGCIGLNSKVGEGTSLSIYIPVSEAERSAESYVREPQDIGGDETILVVEDEDTVRHLTVRLLDSLGYRVLQARNGREAKMIVESYDRRIDLIFTDVVMPYMSGGELIEELRRSGNTSRVLFTSGFSEEVLKHHGVLYREDLLLLKPYTRETLATKIRTILDSEEG